MTILDFRVRPRTDWFYREIVPKPAAAFEAYFRLYSADPSRDTVGSAVDTKHPRCQLATIEESINEMRSSGVTKGVIFAGDSSGNQTVYETCKQHPEVYIGLAGARADHGVRSAYDDLRRAYLEYDLRGLNVSPYLTGVSATDPWNFPLYQLSEELGRCVVIHSSAHYNRLLPLSLSDPMQVDEIACNFPGLKLVITHGGIGFGDIGPTIALRHDNVYLDLTSLHPRVLPPMLLKGRSTMVRSLKRSPRR